MIQRLLEDIQGPQLQDNISKVVKLKCFGDFFSEDSSADTPIFNKRYFQFDKYELAKIMSFEDFELLFRPFKSNSNYRQYVFLKRLQDQFPFLLFCFLILLQVLYLDENVSPYILLSFVCGLIGFTFAAIAFFVYLSNVESKTMKDFREFTGCLIDDGVEIILTTNKDTSWCEWLRRLKHESGAWLVEAQLTYFQIKSHRVKEDLDYVKLYCKGPASVLRPFTQAAPVIQSSQFQFSQEKLNAFLPFKEIEQLMQPFASNQLYRKRLSLFKLEGISIIVLFLLLIPALILIKVQLWQLIVAILDIGMVLTIFVVGAMKLERLMSDVVAEFRQHCRRVSAEHQKVEIIAVLCEQQSKGCFAGENKLYCLLIRHKEVENK